MCAQPRRKSDPEKGRATARLKREEIEEGQTEGGDREYQCQRNLESIPYTGYQHYGIAHSPRLIIYTYIITIYTEVYAFKRPKPSIFLAFFCNIYRICASGISYFLQ
jgi:hypothetical protein